MKTKHLLTLGYLLLSVVACRSQEFQVTLKVTDDFGKPVAGATVGVATFERTEMKAGEGAGEDIWKNIDTTTDTNGMAIIRGVSPRAEIAYGVNPNPGYYNTYTHNAGEGRFSFKKSEAGRWQPWNPTIELVLRPIVNPVPMYAKFTGNLTIPEIGKPIGYDLAIGDWTTPYGKGLKSDIIFYLDRQPDRTVKTTDYYKRDVKLFDGTLTVSFSNPDDGIQAIPVNPQWMGSDFKTPRSAPEDGYESQFVKHLYRETVEKPIVETPKGGLGYFYRVRTVSQDGKIVSALYGKMSDVNFDLINSSTAIISFTYYLNPESNSRNMEFDPKRHLFKNLKVLERVSAP